MPKIGQISLRYHLNSFNHFTKTNYGTTLRIFASHDLSLIKMEKSFIKIDNIFFVRFFLMIIYVIAKVKDLPARDKMDKFT